MDHNEEHNEEDLKREAPTLFGIPKQDGFETPEGYFDSLTSNVSSFVEREEARERIRLQDEAAETAAEPTPSFLDRLVGIFAPRVLAPVVAVVAILIGGYYYSDTPSAGTPSEDEIMMSALDMIDESEGFEFDLLDEDFFAEAYSDESVNALLAEDAAILETGEDALMDYLIDNDIDLETIIDEF